MKFCFLIDSQNISALYRCDEYLIKVLSTYGDIIFLNNVHLSEHSIFYPSVDMNDVKFEENIKSAILSDVRYFIYLSLDVIGPIGKNLTAFLEYIEANCADKLVYMINSTNVNPVFGFARNVLPKIFNRGKLNLEPLKSINYITNDIPDFDYAFDDPVKILNKIPFLSKKFLVRGYVELLEFGRGNQKARTIKLLQQNHYYPVEFIWRYLTKTLKMSDIRLQYNLVDFIPSEYKINSNDLDKEKIAILVYLYYEDTYEAILSRLKDLPENIKIVIVSPKNEIIDNACNYLLSLGLKEAQLRRRPCKSDRCNEMVAYITEYPRIFNKFDYVCVLHDEKGWHFNNRYLSQCFLEHCLDSLVVNANYIHNVIHCFKDQSELGMLIPPTPSFANLFTTDQDSLVRNFDYMSKIYDTLSLSVPFDNYPAAPYGDMFWIRTRAIRPLFRYQWKYEDYPIEPIEADGTLLHALERMLPLVVQEGGFYVSVAGDNDTLRQAHARCYFALREILREEFLHTQKFLLTDILDFLRNHNKDELARLKSRIHRYSFANAITLGKVKFIKHRLQKLNASLKLIENLSRKITLAQSGGETLRR